MKKYFVIMIATIVFFSTIQAVEENFAEKEYTCYGEHCVDPEPEISYDKWGYESNYCAPTIYRIPLDLNKTEFFYWEREALHCSI